MLVKGNKNLDKYNITDHKYSLFYTKKATKMALKFKVSFKLFTQK